MMSKLLVTFTLVLSIAYAQATYVDHFSVNRNEVTNSLCPRSFLHDANELENRILAIAGNTSLVNESVHGLEFHEENKHLVNAFKRLFTRRGHNHPADFAQPQVDLVRDLRISNCHKVLCAVKKVWGQEQGLKILWIMLRYGFNASEFAYDDSETPTNEELNDIISTLDLLPKSAENLILGKNIPFLAFKEITGRMKTPPSSVLANSSIFFFPVLRQRASEDRIQAFHHELGHLVMTNSDLKAEWQEVGGWDWDGNQSNRCIVSRYGVESSGEDFAETFNMYRMAPRRLLSLCPRKYEFMRTKVFHEEYLKLKTCDFQDEVVSTASPASLYSFTQEQDVSPFDQNRFEKLTQLVTQAMNSQSKNVRKVTVNFTAGAKDLDLLDRKDGLNHSLSVSFSTNGNLNLVFQCKLEFKIFGAEAWLKNCSPMNHHQRINTLLPMKRNQLLLSL